MMTEAVLKTTEDRMQKATQTLRNDLLKIRTGRAHPSLVEHIRVSCYDSELPLNQIASISIGDARTLLISPWDRNMVAPIEKAIMQSDLGLNPISAGQVIRVPLPPMTEERRKDLVKHIHHEAENARVTIRNIRRDANTQLKDLLKEKTITEDEEHRSADKIQKITDKYIGETDKILAEKEADLMVI
jgi:ribosome recycling factor